MLFDVKREGLEGLVTFIKSLGFEFSLPGGGHASPLECLNRCQEILRGAEISPSQAKQLAVSLAWLGAGAAYPNPLVGAVLVDEQHRIMGVGACLAFGGDHAEVWAVRHAERQVGSELRQKKGLGLYVTLEPCSFHGKTPSCAKTLSSYSLSFVAAGALDLHKNVRGAGVRILREAGVAVSVGEGWSEEIACLLKIHEDFHRIKRGDRARPYIALKAATSLDGSLGPQESARFPVTNGAGRSYAHWLRRYYDGIAVGAQTVISDLPALDSRLVLGGDLAPWVPIRFVFDGNLRALTTLSQDGLWQNCGLITDSPERTVWVTESSRATEAIQQLTGMGCKDNVTVLGLSRLGPSHLNLEEFFEKIPFSCRSLLLEGGAGLYQGFLEGGYVDRMHLFFGNLLLGGERQVHWMAHTRLENPCTLQNMRMADLNGNWLVEGDITLK